MTASNFLENALGHHPHPPLLIAGPCVLQTRELTLRIAEQIKGIAERYDMPFVFKASYDKANRTSESSSRGPGMEEGLEILRSVQETLDVPVITDVHETAQVKAVADAVDMLQIPAFLCRQTDLLHAAGASGLPVNVKKGQFMAPEDMRFAVEKVMAGAERVAGAFSPGSYTKPGVEETRAKSPGHAGTGTPAFTDSVRASNHVLLTERGASFGYRNLVVDMRALAIMREFAPVIFDGTHSVQSPGGAGGTTGGDRRYVPILVRAALAAGVDGLFLEVHPEPETSPSDAANMITPQTLEAHLPMWLELHDIASRRMPSED